VQKLSNLLQQFSLQCWKMAESEFRIVLILKLKTLLLSGWRVQALSPYTALLFHLTAGIANETPFDVVDDGPPFIAT
jgi:hypothetical protein